MSQWLMIENHLEKRDELSRGKVIVTEVTIITPRRISGLAFPPQCRGKVLKICGLDKAEFREIATDNPTVTLLELKQPHTVIDQTAKGLEALEKIEPILTKYACQLGRDIILHYGSGLIIHPNFRDREALRIFLYATPTLARPIIFERVFDIALFNHQSDAMEILDDKIIFDGKQIELIPILDDNYQLVAILIDNMVYVLFNLPNNRRNAAELTTKLMEQVVTTLTAKPEDLTRIKATIEQRRLEAIKRKAQQFRNEYIQACKKRNNDRARSIDAELGEQEEKVSRLSTQIVAGYRRIEELQQELDLLQQNKLEERYGQEFDRLTENAEIEQVKIVNNAIHVFTTNLHTIRLEDGTIRDLGKYRIEIPINGGEVLAHNLTRKVTFDGVSLHHPHNFYGDAKLCLGNISQGVYQLVSTYEFSVAAQLLIEFLKNPNQRDHYGRRVKQWPIVDETKTPKKPK